VPDLASNIKGDVARIARCRHGYLLPDDIAPSSRPHRHGYAFSNNGPRESRTGRHPNRTSDNCPSMALDVTRQRFEGLRQGVITSVHIYLPHNSAADFGERLQLGAGDAHLAFELPQLGREPIAFGAGGAAEMLAQARQIALGGL
jgi:hypothetical protein